MNSPIGPAGAFPGFASPDAPTNTDLYKCVHCGFCLNACPTYLETGLEAESPRGRIALMKAVNEGRLEITPAVSRHWDLCLQCRACEPACPSGVPYGRLMEATRTEMKARAKRPLVERIGRAVGFRSLLPHQRRLRVIAGLARLYQKTGVQGAVRASHLLNILPGAAARLEAAMPKISDRFFVAAGQVARPATSVRRGKVALLAGCVMPLMHGPTMEAAVRVLTRNGVEVHVPEGQACCGALNAHAGERDTARSMARRNIDAFLATEPDVVVVASAGCGSTMKEYGELLSKDPQYRDRAERVAALTRDIHEYLADLPLEPPRAPLKRRVTYQDACHLANAQRITEAPRRVLRSIPGLELVDLPESAICCGSAGTYSITEPEMSRRLGSRKAGNVASTGAQVVATGNPGCALQMDNALRALGRKTQVRYVIDLLDEAYRGEA